MFTDLESITTTNIGTIEATLRIKHPKGTPRMRKKMFAKTFVSFVFGRDRAIAVESLSSIVPKEAKNASLVLRLSILLVWFKFNEKEKLEWRYSPYFSFPNVPAPDIFQKRKSAFLRSCMRVNKTGTITLKVKWMTTSSARLSALSLARATPLLLLSSLSPQHYLSFNSSRLA